MKPEFFSKNHFSLKNISKKTKKLFFLFFLGGILCISAYFLLKKGENYTSIEKIQEKYPQGYVGSQTCKQCHQKEHGEWQESHHFKAMQHATAETVLGDFNNVTYSADGITSYFFKKDGKFFINTQNSDGKYKDFEIKFTFGFYPLQQYLAEFEGGKLQVFRQSWDSRKGKWFHQYAGEKIDTDDYLHWTNSGQNWNMMCAYCHSTNLQKNYDPNTDTYRTTYSELTIGCETCHGAGKTHSEFMQSTDYQPNKSAETFILLRKNSSESEEINQCMPCHSRRGEVTQYHQFSTEIMDNFIPEIPVKELYFADGQVLEENYKYASFLQSKMYHHGVKCTDCHSPHTGKVKAEGNALCLQCHAPKYATSAHTFHKENTEASDCRFCHMPTRTYMGNDVRHDHNFYVPRPDLTAKYGTPNACNDCHKDKSPKWAESAVNQWFGKERKPHFAENLVRGSEQKTQSLPYLDALLTQKETPNIVKAAAVFYLGGIYTEESFLKIKNELKNSDPQIRYRSVLALANFPIDLYENELISLLSDPVKAVRIATANVFLSQRGLEWSQKLPNFEKSRQEYETFVLSQSDFPLGSATAGDYFSMIGNPKKSILFYERAINKDKQLNHIRLNLATLYNAENQNDKAWYILKEALKYEPNNAQIFYFMALLSSEEKDYAQAKKYFEKTIQLGLDNENVRRNYNIILNMKK